MKTSPFALEKPMDMVAVSAVYLAECEVGIGKNGCQDHILVMLAQFGDCWQIDQIKNQLSVFDRFPELVARQFALGGTI